MLHAALVTAWHKQRLSVLEAALERLHANVMEWVLPRSTQALLMAHLHVMCFV